MKARNPLTALIICMVPALVACWVLFPQNLWAEIYCYIDRNGVAHFTNTPTANKYSTTKYRYIGNEFSGIKYLRSYAAPFAAIDSNKYDEIIKQASKKNGVRYELVKAIIRAESSFNPNAVSPAGACGLMQLMPGNCERFNVNDPFDPHENIMAGTRFFREMLDRYDADLKLSLAAYNAGPGAVDQYQGIPPYPETEDYIYRVINYYNNYKN